MTIRRKQCQKCPWKKSTDPNTIPKGYDSDKHCGLRRTIAGPPEDVEAIERSFRTPLRIMACHKSRVGREIPCVGWLVNQYSEGNNVALRYAVVMGRISMAVETVGDQHERFEDTLPKQLVHETSASARASKKARRAETQPEKSSETSLGKRARKAETAVSSQKRARKRAEVNGS